MLKLRRVTLEVSLKPFGLGPLDAASIEGICARVFRQWSGLTVCADELAILIWAADGSEILDYAGDLDEPFAWACWIGAANPREQIKHDPDRQCLHSRPVLYRQAPPVMTYRILAEIVATLKRVGRQITGKPIRVGATFDPGGEFAQSSFKYQRHNEICLADTMGHGSFACCYATLNADARRYAGFPDGIPQGTSLGRFLGRQAQHFLRDLGFDYLWLSNGFGLGMETWKQTGPLFDGSRFNGEQAGVIRQRILGFWHDFRQECDYPLELRGTNLGTGADLATDAVPLRDIYRGGYNIAAPPNSPWAAINGDFGIELVGYLSRIAELPDGASGYPFRYYVHDPWWLNSPWLDRYARQPHDIYLPLSVSRLDSNGCVQTPQAVAILSVDDSLGQMPESCPREVIPHLLHALEHAPDAPGPLVWVYPFDELHEWTFNHHPPRLSEVFCHDWFISGAINAGLPLNSVVSSRVLLAMTTERRQCLRHGVLLSVVPDAGSALNAVLLDHVHGGGSLLLYGPISRADPQLLDRLGLEMAAPLEGEFSVELAEPPDVLRDTPLPNRLLHRAAHSGGGLDAVARHAEMLLGQALGGGKTRALAVRTGPVAWVASSNANGLDHRTCFHGDLLLRQALARLGWDIRFAHREPGQRRPVVTISRHGGAYWFNGYLPDTTVELRLCGPAGAPLLTDYETELVDGRSCYRFGRAWRAECRVFIRQRSGAVSCAEHVSPHVGVKRRLRLTGLQDAVVRFCPEPGHPAVFQLNPHWPYVADPALVAATVESLGPGVQQVGPVTGTLLISW